MRLPFLQVAQEAWAIARVFGALLGVDQQKAIGIMLDLWSLGLSTGPDDGPPDGVIDGPDSATIIAAHLGWPGATDKLLRALSHPSVRLVDITETSVRIRGLDRYAKAWERNEKAKNKMRTFRERSKPVTGNVPSNVTGTFADKTQTQTYTETESARARGKEKPSTVDSGPHFDFFTWAQIEREARHGFIAEDVLDPPGLRSWWAASSGRFSLEQLRETYRKFLGDTFWRDKRSKWAHFQKHWKDFTPAKPKASDDIPPGATSVVFGYPVYPGEDSNDPAWQTKHGWVNGFPPENR